MLTLKTNKQTVTRFAFSADGARLAVAGTGKKVYLWELTAQKLKPTVLPTFEERVAFLAFLPDGRLFALSAFGQYALHPPTGATRTVTLKNRRWTGDIVAEPDRSALYGTGNEAQKWAFDGRLTPVWSKVVPKTGGDVLIGWGGSVLTPDGQLIASVSDGQNNTWLHTREAQNGNLLSQQLVASSLIRDLTRLPDGKLVFVREQQYKGPTPNALVVGTLGGKFEVVHQATDVAALTALALHPSGKWVAAGQSDGLVRTFDTTTWNEVAAHQWATESIGGIGFAPDGLKAAAGAGKAGQFVVWDIDL